MNDVQAANYLIQRMREDQILRATVSSICSGRGYADLFAWAKADPESMIQFAQSEKDLEEVYENPDLNHVELDPL